MTNFGHALDPQNRRRRGANYFRQRYSPRRQGRAGGNRVLFAGGRHLTRLGVVRLIPGRGMGRWLIVAWCVTLAAWVLGVVNREGSSRDLWPVVFLAAWLVMMALMVRLGVDVVRNGGPFHHGKGAGGVHGLGVPVEIRGAVRRRNPLGLGGPVPFGRLAFDDLHLGIRAPGTDFVVERANTQFIRVREVPFASLVSVILTDGSESRAIFTTRHRQTVVAALRNHGWPMKEEW